MASAEKGTAAQRAAATAARACARLKFKWVGTAGTPDADRPEGKRREGRFMKGAFGAGTAEGSIGLGPSTALRFAQDDGVL